MDAFEDEIGSCCPVKQVCNVVVSVEVFFDRCFPSLSTSEGTAPETEHLGLVLEQQCQFTT